jgi:hypothetical protein
MLADTLGSKTVRAWYGPQTAGQPAKLSAQPPDVLVGNVGLLMCPLQNLQLKGLSSSQRWLIWGGHAGW